MVWSMFIVNDKDGACSSYYTGNLRFEMVSEGLLFWLSAKIFGNLRYFGLYSFALRKGTDAVLMFLAFKRCMVLN